MYSRTLAIIAVLILAMTLPLATQQSAEMPGQKTGTMLLTVFLRHDQSKTLEQINAQLHQTGFDRNFPPSGVEVVSWYVMMGIGQVVTLRFPPEKLREVNVIIERQGWGAYRTDFYPTYDYKPIWEAERKKLQEAK